MPSAINTQTDTLVGYGMDRANPGGLIENNDTIGETVPKAGYFTNITTNNYFGAGTSTVSAGDTTVLTVDSARFQLLTGSSNQNYQLPDATTIPEIGQIYYFNNNSSGSLVVKNNAGTTQVTVPAGGIVCACLTSNSTANGTWDFHPEAPATVTWGSGTTGLVMNSALSTSAQIGAGASSSTAPVFLPQRGSSTTGFGGDSTHLYAIISGTAAWTASAIAVSVPVGNALTAAGTTIADALQLSKQINNVTTAAASTGVILPVGAIGMRITVFNAGANPIKVYANDSETIDGTAGATGVTLTNAKRCDYFFVAANTWISAQLGVVSA